MQCECYNVISYYFIYLIDGSGCDYLLTYLLEPKTRQGYGDHEYENEAVFCDCIFMQLWFLLS